MANGPVSSEDLRLGIERIERLEEEKKGIADDIKDVYAEYKAKGFDTKTMREIVRLRKLKPEERREREAMLDLYKGVLGMLDGTPLGRWATDRLDKADKHDDADGGNDGEEKTSGAPDGDADGAAGTDDTAPAPEPDTAEAREMGRAAAREGQPVTSNPFPARDIRRAAWDEAWCQELGSDGMDIPDALKPKPKAKKEKSTSDGAADGAADEGAAE